MSSVVDAHREALADLCRRTGAKRLDLFGSAARTDFDRERSDLDFLVEFEELPPAQYADAYFQLKDSLEALFGRPVDLVTTVSLENPYFRERVFAERQLLYLR